MYCNRWGFNSLYTMPAWSFNSSYNPFCCNQFNSFGMYNPFLFNSFNPCNSFNPFYYSIFSPNIFGGCNNSAFNSGFKFGILNSMMNNMSSMFTPVSSNNNLYPSLFPTISNNRASKDTSISIKTSENLSANPANKTNEKEIKKTTKENRKKDKNFKNSANLDKKFLRKVKHVAKKLNCDYQDLLALMNSESGINPSKWNGTTAVGLIQFTQPAIDDLNQKYKKNLTKEKIAGMTATEQLEWVEKYLLIAKNYAGFSKKHHLSAGDLYAITFLPGRATREVLCTQGENYYSQNKGLDLNKDGKITKSELDQRIKNKSVDESIFA